MRIKLNYEGINEINPKNRSNTEKLGQWLKT